MVVFHSNQRNCQIKSNVKNKLSGYTKNNTNIVSLKCIVMIRYLYNVGRRYCHL